MAKITSTKWKIKPHTEAKHAILRKYLDAWLPIITRWNDRVLYIDGFAGPGEYVGGKDGSPIIAIRAVLEHRTEMTSQINMFFIENKKERYEFLEQKIADLEIPGNINTHCFCDKFDKAMAEILDYVDEQKTRLAPAFVFVDPFGFTGIPFALIKRIMQNPKCEVLITFMYEEINRFVSDERRWDSLEETFGTDKWKEVIGEKDPQRRLVLLHGVYKNQLKREAGIKFVRSFKMVNKTNKADYFLFFGTNNIIGLEKMKGAMWKVGKTDSFQFSDATYDPDQPMLFEIEPNYKSLKTALLENFRGESVSMTDLEYFILTQTPFLKTHYKKQILMPMEKKQPPEIEVKCPAPKRIAGTFPSRCTVRFL